MAVRGRIPAPLVYTPINCRNPVLVAYTAPSIEVAFSDSPDNRIHVMVSGGGSIGDAVAGLVKKFIEELGCPEGLVAEARVLGGRVYGLGVYSFITYALLREAGLGSGEALDIASRVDAEVLKDPIRASVCRALREAIARGAPIVYREGEGSVEVRGLMGVCASVIDHIEYGGEGVRMLLGEQAFRAAIIHMGGYAAISTARCFLSGEGSCDKVLTEALAVLNSLQYIVKGVHPPPHGFLVDDLPGLLALLALEDGVCV